MMATKTPSDVSVVATSQAKKNSSSKTSAGKSTASSEAKPASVPQTKLGIASTSQDKPDVQSASAKPDPAAPSDAETLLKADHRKVEKLFQQYESAESEEDKETLVKQICTELIVHAQLEEEIFYPACREADIEDDLLDEAQVEHDGAKVLITQLITLPIDSAYYDAKVKVLSEYIKHHVGEEEKPSDGIFAKARSAGVDLTELGKRITSRKEELLAQGESGILQPPIPRSLEVPDFINRSIKENQAMANQQNRDDQGRFTNQGNGGSSNGRNASNYQYDDQDNYSRNGGRSSSQSGNRDRDDQGRFTSDDDNRGRGGYYDRDQEDNRTRSGSGRSNRDDNDYDDNNSSNRQGRGQGQGWFGDSEGHSQAARRGNQSSGRSSRDDDDDDGRNGNRSSGGGNRGGQGQGQGWFGDSEGHSQAARRGNQSSGRSSRDDNDDDGRNGNRSSGNGGNRGGQGQGHGGWFGDPEGHSQAARRGSQSSSRSSRDDDDDDRGRGRSSGNRGGQSNQDEGHGGWFGDSEGHAEAARRGWENRH